MKTPVESRRNFLYAAGATLVLPTGTLLAQAPAPQTTSQTASPRPRPPKLGLGLVEEFVRAAHVNLERTMELFTQEPALLNSTGTGAAATGKPDWAAPRTWASKEIANFLIGQGARMDIFAAAMLGRLDIVKALLDAFPTLLHSKGPHGISLIKHALKGGDEAAAVVALLESLGATA